MSEKKKPNWKHVPDAWITALIANKIEEDDFHHVLIHAGECEVCRERIWDKRREVAKTLAKGGNLPAGFGGGLAAALSKAVSQLVGGNVELVGLADLSDLMGHHEAPGKTKKGKKKGDQCSDEPSDSSAQEWFISFMNSVRPMNELERQTALRCALMIPPNLDHTAACVSCQEKFAGLFDNLPRMLDQLTRVGNDLKTKLPDDVDLIEEIVGNLKSLKEEIPSVKPKPETGDGQLPNISLS